MPPHPQLLCSHYQDYVLAALEALQLLLKEKTLAALVHPSEGETVAMEQ